jgi:peptide/nickel transport system substrate-binding protein
MMPSDDQSADPFEEGLTRRRLVGRALTVGGGLAAVSGLGGALAQAHETATPVRGGTLRATSSSAVDQLGTALWGGAGWALGYAQFNTLVRLTPDGKRIEPELAEKIDVTRGGRRYTFKLHSGVRFSDGTALTADDVKFTLERAMDPKSTTTAQSLYSPLGITGTAAFTSGKAKEISGIQAIDPLTVQITLDHPNSALLYTLAMSMAGIVPKAYVTRIGSKAFETKPIGSGPYRLKSYDVGKQIVLEQNPNYWDPTTSGYVASVQWDMNVDPQLAALRILKGELDMMMDPLPTGLLNSIRRSPSQAKQLRIGRVNNVFFVTNSLDNQYTKHLAVRQAIGHAINRDRVVRALGAVPQAANGGLFSPLSPYFQPGMNFSYNPGKAKALLNSAGFSAGFPLINYVQALEPQKTIAQSVQADLAEVGIELELKILPPTAWVPIVIKNPPEMVTGQWELPYPHGSYVMDSAFTRASLKSGCCNFSNYTSARFERLDREAGATTAPARLASLYKQMDRLAVHDQALWLPVIYPGYATVISPRLQGYVVPGTPAGDAAFFRRYWLTG